MNQPRSLAALAVLLPLCGCIGYPGLGAAYPGGGLGAPAPGYAGYGAPAPYAGYDPRRDRAASD